MAAAVSPASPLAVVVVVLVVLPGSSEVGDAMMETGRSWTRGCASAPLGVVMRVTYRQRHSVTRVIISIQCFHYVNTYFYYKVRNQRYNVTAELVLREDHKVSS